MEQTASVTAAAGQYITKDELTQALHDEVERLRAENERLIAECPTCAERGYDNDDYHRLHRAWCDSVAENERLRAALEKLDNAIFYDAQVIERAGQFREIIESALHPVASQASSS
jgi:hypothetical protein